MTALIVFICLCLVVYIICKIAKRRGYDSDNTTSGGTECGSVRQKGTIGRDAESIGRLFNGCYGFFKLCILALILTVIHTIVAREIRALLAPL